MIKLKKLSILTIIAFLIQILPLQPFLVFADTQASPTQLAIDGTDENPGILYSSSEGHYVKLKWTAPNWSGDTQYYELYYAEDGSSTYQKYGETILGTQTTAELHDLKGGTVYHAYLKAVHEHYDVDGNLTGKDESSESNEIDFMTNIDITAIPGENSSLNVEWTDVIYQSRRISYNLYISESKEFGQTTSVYIGPSNIGTDNVVKPVNGKLLYNATDLKAGTVYYIKIQPLLNDDQVEYLSESEIINGYTFILASISQMSSDWWKLEWNSITNTNLEENQEIIYKIKRRTEGDLEKEISATKDTKMFVKVTDTSTYYRVQADIISELGEAISIVSPEVNATETEVPATPSVPEIMEELSNQTMVVGPDSLKVLWKAPTSITGDIDQSIFYDIWMLDDPDDINDDTIVPKVSNLYAGPDNYVYEMIGNTKSDNVIGYQYTITGLTPNKTYYLKMTAKKKYIVNEDGTLVNKDFSSEPALKVVITPSSGSIEQPVAPSKPPFMVKTVVVNDKTEQAVTSTTVTLQWKNEWYELWNNTDDKWEYANDEDIQEASVQGEAYRFVNYGSDVKFSVGYEVYTDDFDFSRLSETVSAMPMQFTNISNNTSSDTVEFNVTGLTPNTPYVMWIRAYRSGLLKSGLSDPVVVTTKTEHEIPTEKPAIPVFNYGAQEDTYVELGWDVNRGYVYTIKYSTEDNVSGDTEEKEVTYDNMQLNNRYKIEGLQPDTTYFFWIMASVTGADGETLSSDWGDAYVIKTKVEQPPDIPSGFGLKNIAQPVDKYSIYYEWTKVDGLDYILEVAKKSDFSDAVSYTITDASEYKLENLNSNTRYYARLYAYNSEKSLKSKCTAVVSVRTLQSNDEYDSDINLDSYIAKPATPALDKDNNGTLDITGTNVDIFIKQICDDASQDYFINFAGLTTKEMTKSQINLSSRVLVALNQLKKTITLENGKASLTIKPDILDSEQVKYIYQKNPEFVMKLVFEKPSTSAAKPLGAASVSDQWKITLTAGDGRIDKPVTGLKNSIKIKIPYTSSTWFDKNTMSGYTYNEEDKTWTKTDTTNTFDKLSSKGFVYADIPGNCSYQILKWSTGRFADIGGSPFEADINAIVNKYNMKSLSNSNFEPSRNITKAEAVKILLDVMNSNYDDNYIDMASKAKITSYINMQDTGSNLTREQGASMLARIYELITGQKAESTYSLNGYSDAKTIDPNLLPRVRFAVEKGILKSNSSGVLIPKYSLTRGEMMSMVKNMLVQAGVM